jgi:hypothetical protein
MAEYGYNRVIKELSWDHESIKLVGLYSRIFLKVYSTKNRTLIPGKTKPVIMKEAKSLNKRQNEPVLNDQMHLRDSR